MVATLGAHANRDDDPELVRGLPQPRRAKYEELNETDTSILVLHQIAVGERPMLASYLISYLVS